MGFTVYRALQIMSFMSLFAFNVMNATGDEEDWLGLQDVTIKMQFRKQVGILAGYILQ